MNRNFTKVIFVLLLISVARMDEITTKFNAVNLVFDNQ
jgi:hypothetical protein